MKKCVYCNRDINDGIIINESDIIPEALCNKRIILDSKINNFEPENCTMINVNETDLEEVIKVDVANFYSVEMLRLVTKIIFEWICKKDSISSQR